MSNPDCSQAFIPSALVASLTPTIVLDEKIGTNAAISFSRSNFAARNGIPDIQCGEEPTGHVVHAKAHTVFHKSTVRPTATVSNVP